GIPGEIRKGFQWIAMEGAVQNIRALVEDVLRAVAVMEIDVEDGHACAAVIAQVLRGDRRIMEKAMAAVQVGGRVVPRRGAEPKGAAPPLDEPRRCGERH